jgi:serine-type D-Ala-D-Ala carboxypeptidase (penicillin-binding protein 5/6)
MIFRVLFIAAALLLAVLPAQAFETRARAAWVYDMTTNTVLMDKNGQELLPPASMSKLMTVEMLFQALKEGRVQMDSSFGVSADAMKFNAQNGSTMFLQRNDRPTVSDLIQGMVVNSGNDACTVVAEGLEGSEAEFARKMNDRAAALGLQNSTFANSSGWPDPGQRMSMQDLGLLAVHLITTYPDLYPVFSQTEFNYKNRAPANANNRNPLLALGIGADGLKTGHTEEAGFGMVGSVKQGDRRIVFAITGLATAADRASEAENIANWAFRQFALKTVAKAGSEVAQAPVFMGDAATVSLVPEADLRLLVPAGAGAQMQAEVTYSGPLKAPIAKGTKLAQLVVHLPNMPDHSIDLVAATDVGAAGFFDRLKTATRKLKSDYIDDKAPAT